MPPGSPANQDRLNQELNGAFGAIVLAGSYGWGTGHIPALPPRPLAAVALRPAITYGLEWLIAGGATAITICANQSSRLLQERLGGTYQGVGLSFRGDQLPRGPAGSLRDAIEDIDGETFVVIEATLIPRLNLRGLLDAHRRTQAAVTVVTTTSPDCASPAGIYVLERSALAHVPPTGFQDLKETLLPRLYREGASVLPYTPEEEMPRVGNLDSYLSTNAWVVEHLAGGRARAILRDGCEVQTGAITIGPVLVGAGARIEAGATVVGPAVIGDRSVVADGALVSRSVVGEGCLIGRSAMVHGSVVTDGSAVADGQRLQRRVHLPPSTIAARLAHFFTGGRTVAAGRVSTVSHTVAGRMPVNDAPAETL